MISYDIIIFAYFSPETLLPAASIVATVVGAMMMLGPGSWRFAAECVRRGFRRGEPVARVNQPQIRLKTEAHSEAPYS
jgi:hypothetical protein